MDNSYYARLKIINDDFDMQEKLKFCMQSLCTAIQHIYADLQLNRGSVLDK